MSRKILFYTFLLLVLRMSAQDFKCSGSVVDAENNEPLVRAIVRFVDTAMYCETDDTGKFVFNHVAKGNYKMEISFFGFQKISKTIFIDKDTQLNFEMHPIHFSLSEVIVHAKHAQENLQKTLPVQNVSRYFMQQNNSTNFVKTLSNIPGIASMDIGAGFSKPIIRGLGFNRVAVVDKGIVQQNQQWGADHGLEIDQYDIDNVAIHKGPMSLFFGSDAIGGVIEIKQPNILENGNVQGETSLIAKSNNDLLGASMMMRYKHNQWFFRTTLSTQYYGDYRIPADTIDYLTWRMPVYNRRMKNTAGKEYAVSASINYKAQTFDNWLHISDVYGKSGFYPGSHGVPDIGRLQHDGAYRNISMPLSWSNHLKVINNMKSRLGKGLLYIDLGYQLNFRREMSAFHTHYSNQKPPLQNPDIELEFRLNTFSVNARYVIDSQKKWEKIVGMASEFQHNRVAGYSYLLPDFERRSGGLYFINEYKLNNEWLFSGGVRYDVGQLHVHGYYDKTLNEYLLKQNYDIDDRHSYAQRAEELNKTFGDMSASMGFSFTPNVRHTLKLNIGKSFRFPGANELAANGVHHGAFRHEKGNNTIQSELGYQMDIDYLYKTKHISLVVNPFFSYFSNYIYLNPTGVWSVLPHTGQIYAYQQAKALITGGEIHAGYTFDKQWSVASEADYIYSLNLTSGYPLPFSPPARWTNSVEYKVDTDSHLRHFSAKLSNRQIMAQNRIARNEEKTPATNLWNLAIHTHWRWQAFQLVADVQVQNIFDTAYLNHLSFYRKLNAPEPGRNIQLILKIPF